MGVFAQRWPNPPSTTPPRAGSSLGRSNRYAWKTSFFDDKEYLE
jgi:hypothetical protein